jgi:hemoglobin
MSTMFDRYGDFATVSRIVSAFYDQVMDTPELEHYFQNTNMARLIDHQTKFIASVMGGPAAYSVDQLERAHSHVGINEKDFVTVVKILRETLEDFEIDESDIVSVIGIVMSAKRAIITAP